MENRDFTYQNHNSQTYKNQKYNNNTPVSSLFNLIQDSRFNPLDANQLSKDLLEEVAKFSDSALSIIHCGIERLGKTLAIVIQNENAGIDTTAISDVGYLIQMLGDMANSILSFKNIYEDALKNL